MCFVKLVFDIGLMTVKNNCTRYFPSDVEEQIRISRNETSENSHTSEYEIHHPIVMQGGYKVHVMATWYPSCYVMLA